MLLGVVGITEAEANIGVEKKGIILLQAVPCGKAIYDTILVNRSRMKGC